MITCTGDQPRAQNAGNRAPAPQERASGPDPDLLGASIGRAPGGRPPSPSRRRRSIRPVINTRRWLANRRLWRPELPLPAAVRWAPATGQHTGAGSIVALPPPPVAWAAAWPELPTVAAVQLVHVDAQGQPALDRPAEAGGREKRAMGMLQGAAVVLSNPLLPEASAPAHVAEGLADALALASRMEGTAIAALGTSGMMGQDQLLAQWLAGAAQGVRVHCDADEPKQGRPPAPRRAAPRRGCADAGGQRRRRRGTDRSSGPGLQGLRRRVRPGPDFGPLPEGWDDYASTLRETTDWPRWQIARVATNVLHEL